VFTLIRLAQVSVTLSTTPNTFAPVGIVGGFSSAITVETDPALTWQATVVTTGTGGGRSLVQHQAKLVLFPQGTEVVAGTNYPADQQFRVEFPKVYYPNREIPISATVTVMVQGLTSTFTVNQSSLTDRGMNAVGVGTSWGELTATGSNYNSALVAAFRRIPGYTFLGNRGTGLNPNVTGATFVHVTNTSLAANFGWGTINTWMNTNPSGILFMSADNTAAAAINSFNSATSPMRTANWPNIQTSGSSDARMYAEHANRKVYQFAMGADATRVGSGTTFIPSVTGMTADGYSTSVPIAGLPTSAVVLMNRSLAAQSGQAMFVIDPAGRIVFNGESTSFDGTTGNRPAFLDNVMFIISNGARYGSHFMDMFIDTGLPGAVPAPWDSYWDGRSTGGTDNRGVPSR
jgi:hypothetical protein